MSRLPYIEIGIIDECVQNALYTGNHNAIADILVEKKLWKKNVFAHNLANSIERSMKKQGLTCEGIKEMTRYIYDFSIVSSEIWEVYPNDLEEADQNYQEQQVKNWINGEAIPPRNAIIQICLWMALTIEESNQLLRAAGYPVLYYVNALDVVTMYYLKKYQGFSRLSKEQFIEVKNGYYKVAEWLSKAKIYRKKQYNAEDKQISMIRNMEKSKKGKKEYYLAPDTDSYYEIKEENKVGDYSFKKTSLAYDDRLSVCADKNKIHFLEKRNKSGSVTKYMIDEFGKYMESEDKFFDFIKDNIEYLGQLHYGFFQKMQGYLEGSEYYQKNIYNYEGEFTVEDEGQILRQILKKNDRKEIIIGLEELINKESLTNKKKIITSLLAIEYRHLDQNKEINLRDPGSYSTLSTFFYGRQVKNPIDGQTKYIYQHPTKVMLIRMLIVMGQEDRIGEMMIQAGYWDKDWIDENQNNVERCDYLDTSDWLIIYMVRFRNALLKTWAQKKEKDEKTFFNQKREIFPFHRMVLEVSESVKNRMKNNGVYEEGIEKYFPVHNSGKDRSVKE